MNGPLKKSHDEEKAVSCLILGTESSMIYILDPEAFTILDTLIVPAPPSHLAISGKVPVFYCFMKKFDSQNFYQNFFSLILTNLDQTHRDLLKIMTKNFW